MAQVRAFGALRYTDKGKTALNVCPPYDIISEEQRLGYISESPENIIRLEKPVGDNAYAKARETYLGWLKSGVIACDEKPGIYVYEEEFEAYGKTKKLRGIFTRVKLEEFSKGVVLPHEETLSKAKQDRFELMCATGCNFSPIYSMYSDENRVISSRVMQCSAGKPEIEFTAEDGVIQRLWKIENREDIAFLEKAFEDKKLFIADGHHRYETALRYRDKLISDGVIKDENHPANYCMMMLIDMENDGLVVFPTHRIVKGLENYDETALLDKISAYFDVTGIEQNEIQSVLGEKDSEKVFVMCSKDKIFYKLTMKDGAQQKVAEMNPGKTAAYTSLDVTVLHSLILENILGIDKQNMANQINLNYTRDISEAIDLVNCSHDVNCAFLIRPTLISQIKDAALAGEKMPQKSTYFYPKLITGLVMNQILDPDTI